MSFFEIFFRLNFGDSSHPHGRAIHFFIFFVCCFCIWCEVLSSLVALLCCAGLLQLHLFHLPQLHQLPLLFLHRKLKIVNRFRCFKYQKRKYTCYIATLSFNCSLAARILSGNCNLIVVNPCAVQGEFSIRLYLFIYLFFIDELVISGFSCTMCVNEQSISNACWLLPKWQEQQDTPCFQYFDFSYYLIIQFKSIHQIIFSTTFTLFFPCLRFYCII